MVQQLQRLLGRTEIRVLVLLVCGILLAGFAVSIAQLTKTSSDLAAPTVSSWDELLKDYLLFRECYYALVVPDGCLPYGEIEAMLEKFSFGDLQKQPGWYWNFDGGTFVFETDSELAKQLGESATLVVYEDMENGEILILRVPQNEDEDYNEEIVYRAPRWPKPMKGEDAEVYLWRELSKRRIAWQVTLKTRKLAEEEQATEETEPLLLKTSGEDLLLRFGEDYTNHLWLSVEGPNDGLTNVVVGVHVPGGFTNRLEVFSITNLLSFPWSMVETNLSADGTSVVYWADPAQGESEFGFYAVGNADSDADEDGITGAREKFLYGTDPQNWDTDGDGASDGDELTAATDPLVNPGDRDGDGLSDDLEVVIGTDPDEADSDGDWVSDGHEYEQGTDPLDDEDAPDLRLVLNDGAMYAISTNLELQIQGLVADDLVVAESSAMENAVTNPCSEVSIFSLPNDSNGVRSVCAVAIRGGTNVGFTGVASIILDTSPPGLQVTNLANESVTANRWVPIQGVATDAVSSVGVWINGGWADGVSSGSFWKTRFALSPGTNVVTLTAKDAAGNCTTQEWTVVQDLSLDGVAPTMDFGLPSDFVIDGGTTSWNYGVATFGDEAKLGFVGGIDDDTALVDVWVESALGTNGPYKAAVGAKTQVWAEVMLFEGSNRLVGLASDAAGNVSTCEWTVVRDTSFVFRITSPEPYATINGPSVDVTCVASPCFSNAQVTVNGQATYLVPGSNPIFQTTAPVALGDGVTKLSACAVLDGRSYYADPPAARYEIIDWMSFQDHSFMFKAVTQGEDPESGAGWWNWRCTWDECSGQYSVVSRENWWYRWWDGSVETHTTPGYWVEPMATWPNEPTRFGNRRVSYANTLAVGSWIYTWDGDLSFIKLFMQMDKELVLLQFPGLDYGRPPGQSINPAAITYRGQPGFWYNGNVTFVTEIERDTPYAVNAGDFTWPSYTFADGGSGWSSSESVSWLQIWSVMNRVLRMDIEQSQVLATIGQTDVLLNLTRDSYWSTGAVTWVSTPGGLGGVMHNNTNFWFDPKTSVPGCYSVAASAVVGGVVVSDTCSVYIIKIDSVDVHSSDPDTHKIPAVSGAAHDDHFVCAKDTGDVVLNATVLPNDPAVLDQLVWEADGATITYPAVGTDKRTAKLSSSSSARVPVRIKVSGSTCWEGVVWVIWASGSSNNRPLAFTVGTFGSNIEADWDFTWDITPAQIITDADRPDLSGANTVSPPNGSKRHVISNNPLSGGATNKWDASRQGQFKVVNPHLYTKAQLPSVPGTYYDNQPVAVDLPDVYPSDPAEGNDDSHPGDEDNDPYTLPDQGKLTAVDTPSAPMKTSTGVLNDTYEERYHFREFARIELGGVWYRMSDSLLWRVHYKYKKADTEITTGANGICNTTASGDDVQAITLNSGKAGTTSITAGTNGTIDTTAAGDDQLIAGAITTGANGICNTTATGDDVQVIPVGNGEANAICITSGVNTKLDTTASGDDAGATTRWVDNGSDQAADNNGF